MKLSRLFILLIGSLIVTANVVAQSPSPSPSPSPLSAEERAAREKRLAERRAERRADDAKRAAERRAKNEKRAEEFKARRTKEASERQAREVKRAAERKLRTEKQTAEREAMAAKRAIARQEAAKARQAAQARAASDTFKFVSSRMNSHFNRVVKGAPYSAVAVSEFVQKFVDGNQIVRRNEVSFYRDSEGRMRVEQKLNTIGKWRAEGDAPRMIMIGDPVSGEYYDLDPRTRTAVKNLRIGKRLQELKQKQEQDPGQNPKANVEQKTSVTNVSSDGRRRTESLGSQRIEGVEAQGKRTTVTIPAGEIGNTLPIEITDESWYSPELQTLVMTRRHDPRSGATTYRLTNISRREPERSLFQVPADYTIVDKSAPKPAPKIKTETNKVSKSQIF